MDIDWSHSMKVLIQMSKMSSIWTPQSVKVKFGGVSPKTLKKGIFGKHCVFVFLIWTKWVLKMFLGFKRVVFWRNQEFLGVWGCPKQERVKNEEKWSENEDQHQRVARPACCCAGGLRGQVWWSDIGPRLNCKVCATRVLHCATRALCWAIWAIFGYYLTKCWPKVLMSWPFDFSWPTLTEIDPFWPID